MRRNQWFMLGISFVVIGYILTLTSSPYKGPFIWIFFILGIFVFPIIGFMTPKEPELIWSEVKEMKPKDSKRFQKAWENLNKSLEDKKPKKRKKTSKRK